MWKGMEKDWRMMLMRRYGKPWRFYRAMPRIITSSSFAAAIDNLHFAGSFSLTSHPPYPLEGNELRGCLPNHLICKGGDNAMCLSPHLPKSIFASSLLHESLVCNKEILMEVLGIDRTAQHVPVTTKRKVVCPAWTPLQYAQGKDSATSKFDSIQYSIHRYSEPTNARTSCSPPCCTV